MFGPFCSYHVSVDPFYDLLQVCNQSVYSIRRKKKVTPHEDGRMKQPTSCDVFLTEVKND